MNHKKNINDIISLAKRRGFVFPGSQIYGGLANTYDFGPLGVELLRNIQNYWWNYFVSKRSDIFGLDTSILMNPKVWDASGHTQSFTDVLIDCKNCQTRTRADHLIENHFQKKGESRNVEGKSTQDLDKIIKEEKISCPNCNHHLWTNSRPFNLLFETNIGILPDTQSKAYLRGEIAQGMFINFKNVTNTIRPKLPFGLAQQGKAFRNEITLGNFIFRTLEFNLSEIEYFFDPAQSNPDTLFQDWKHQMHNFATSLGLSKNNLAWRPHTDQERSHYSSKTQDLEYNFPFGGFKELFGLANRTDYDLKNHIKHSGQDLRYTDHQDNKNKLIPHVIEPTFGINRIFLAILSEGYTTSDNRTILKLPFHLAPYHVAVFPLLANKGGLIDKASNVRAMLDPYFSVAWDQRGNIGKRYLAQDEIGTPFCITIDFETLQKNTVTIRHRDTTKQDTIQIDKLKPYLSNNFPKST